MTTEAWVRLPPPFNTFYMCSSHGRIKSLDRLMHGKSKMGRHCFRKVRGRILKTENKKNGAGYLGVCLNVDGFQYYRDVHRIVAICFLGPPTQKNMQVNHRDGNRLNNRVENLEWVTPSQNIQHAKARGARFGRPLHGEENPKAKLTSSLVKTIFKSKLLASTLAEKYGVSISTIHKIRQGRAWKNLKLIWPS